MKLHAHPSQAVSRCATYVCHVECVLCFVGTKTKMLMAFTVAVSMGVDRPVSTDVTLTGKLKHHLLQTQLIIFEYTWHS